MTKVNTLAEAITTAVASMDAFVQTAIAVRDADTLLAQLKEKRAQMQEQINGVVSTIRAALPKDKDGNRFPKRMPADRSQWHPVIQAYFVAWEKAGVSFDTIQRVYYPDLKRAVQDGKAFMLNSARYEAEQKKKADKLAAKNQVPPVEPNNSTPSTVTTTSDMAAVASEDGNNRPDLQQHPNTSIHDQALNHIGAAIGQLNALFPLCGNLNTREWREEVKAMALKLDEFRKFVQEAKS